MLISDNGQRMLFTAKGSESLIVGNFGEDEVYWQWGKNFGLVNGKLVLIIDKGKMMLIIDNQEWILIIDNGGTMLIIDNQDWILIIDDWERMLISDN